MIVEILRLKDVDLVLHQTAELADPLTLTNLNADRTPAEPLWAAHPASSAQATRPNSTVYPKPTILEHARSSLESATCARVLLLALQRARRLQGRRSNRAVPLSVPPLPRASLTSPPPLLPPRGQLLQARRAFDPPSPRLRISGGVEFCLGPYEHLSASLPLPSRLPHPVGARAPIHSHSQARVRTPARLQPWSLQRLSADPRSPGRRYSHRLPAATGRPLSAAAAAAAAAAEGTATAARPRLPAPCPGQSPGEAKEEEDAEARRSRAAPGAPLRAAGCLRSPYGGPSLGGLRSAAGRKLSSPPRLLWVLLLFVTVPSRGELGHLGQVFVGGSAPCLAQREVKEALGQPDSAAARVQSPRLGRWTPAASPPLRTRHVRASHGRGPSQTTPRPPPARPQPPHRLDTRGSRVLIG
nr:translation initiation factor IF-2-like [Gorilla gorilla gorilla]